MKTKLNKKSFAAGLTAVALSAVPFIGISLLTFPNANASCEVKRNNKVFFKCDGDEGNCQEELKKTEWYLNLIPGEITIQCSGQKVAIEEDETDDNTRPNN